MLRTAPSTSGALSLHYLAEGAANIVYSFRPFKEGSHDIPITFVGRPDKSLLGKVIRISKGLDKTSTAEQIKADFDSDIRPMFVDSQTASSKSYIEQQQANYASAEDSMAVDEPPVDFSEHLMNLELVSLAHSVIPILNKEISTHSRRFKGSVVEGASGLVMEDMSSVPGKALTIEIKLKWLVQSPNAPSGAIRCRTCALQASRHGGKPSSDAYICPLQLHAGNKTKVEHWVLQKVRQASKGPSEPLSSAVETAIVASITDYLATGKGHNLLNHIRGKQLVFDKAGVLQAPESISGSRKGDRNYDLRLAMTLRDCSLFIQTTYQGDLETKSKLGDLDFKHEDKMSDWRAKEEELISGGWYNHRADVDDNYGGCLIAEVSRGES